jgi:chemotaxis protein MotA
MPSTFRAVVLTRPTGAALALTTLAAGMAAYTGFLDPMSLLITVGGSLAVTRLTFPRARLLSAWGYLGEALGVEAEPALLIRAFRTLAGVHRAEGERGLEEAATSLTDPFLRRAIELALECRDEAELHDTLLAEARKRLTDGEGARQVMVTLGKLLPAFGLIGTLIGLALLLRNLASADIASIGPGLGIAVLTTLYGAVLSNVVVLPLATKLQAHLARETLRLQVIIEGTLLVHRKEYPSRIERVLRTYIGASVGLAAPDDGLRLAADAA